MTPSSEINEFLNYIASEKALSHNTSTAYEKDLESFYEYTVRKKLLISDVSLQRLRDFLATLRKQGLSQRSIARKLSAIKQLYKFLLREGRVENDPSELVTLSIREKKLPKSLSVEEMFKLIACASGNTESEVRDRALLELWYATGTRVSEMATLTIDAIDFTDRVIKVIGKGNKERIIPFGDCALEWCLRYKEIRHQWLIKFKLKETSTFFINRSGKAFTRQGIWKVVKKYAKMLGIEKRVWPHLIRHSFATHVLQGGADLRAVQELLGHRSIATTEVYTHLDIENLKAMQIKYHPRR